MWTPRSGGSMPIERSVSISSGWATMPAPRPASSPSTRSYTSTAQPARRSSSAARSPLMEPPTTRARRDVASFKGFVPAGSQREKTRYIGTAICWRNEMARSMVDKAAERSDERAWPAEIKAEFEREAKSPNPCVGTTLVSESDRVRVWMIRLAPGERIGFHRHVLDYFWTSVTGGGGRPPPPDGTTGEYTSHPGETPPQPHRPRPVQRHH